MKIYKNESLRAIKSEDIKNLEDMAVIFESASKIYRVLLKRHFDYQKMVEDGVIPEVFHGAKTIAKDLCAEKTVHRFNADLGAIIFKRNRYRNGKQTSNSYKMNKTAYQFLKAFWRLGLWKEGVDFDERWVWIKNLWDKCGSNTIQFMNKVWNYKSPKDRGLDGSYEHADKKMSHGNNQKCPTTSKLLSLGLEEYGTPCVPAAQLDKICSLLRSGIRKTFEDIKWYGQKQPIRNHAGLFSCQLANHLRPNKVY